MRLLSLILLAGAAFGQTTTFPNAIDTNASLFVTADNVQSTLSTAVVAGDTSLTVASGTGFAANQIATICDVITSTGKCTTYEHMLVTGAVGNVLTVTRGFAGTSARAHSAGKLVSVLIDAAHQKVLKDAVIALETVVGVNGANMGGTATVTSAFNFAAQSPGGTLSAGNNAITMTPVPAGVNGNDSYHWLYVSGGTGTAEACLINGGSGRSGDASGQIIMACSNSHSGAWTVASATGGIREAFAAVMSAGRGSFYVPSGSITMRSQLYVPPGVSLRLIVDSDLVFGSDIGANDGVWIDSCEACVIEWSGSIAYQGSGYATRFQPSNPAPSDNIKNIQWSYFRFNNIQSYPNGGSTGSGVPIAQANVLIIPDGDAGPPAQGLISHNEFHFLSLWGALNGIIVDKTGGTDGWFEESQIFVTQLVHYTQTGIRACGTSVVDLICPNNIWNVTVVYPRDDGTGLAPQNGFSTGNGSTSNIINVPSASVPSGKKAFIYGSGSSSNRITGDFASGALIDDSSGNVTNTFQRTGGQSATTDISSEFPGGGPSSSHQNTSNRDETIVVSGGTVTAINISPNGGGFFATGETAGVFPLRQGEAIQVVYTGSPTVKSIQK